MRTRNNNNKKNNDLHIWSPFGEAECRRQMGNVSVLRGQKWTQQKSKAKKKKRWEINGVLTKSTVSEATDKYMNQHTHTHTLTWAGCGGRISHGSWSGCCQRVPPAPSAASSSGHWSESSPPPPPPAASSAASVGPSTYPAAGEEQGGGRGGKGQSAAERSSWQEIAGKERPRRRSRDRYLNGEISVRTGGPMGIRSQIKPGRLLQMMLWEESQCLCCDWGIYILWWNMF